MAQLTRTYRCPHCQTRLNPGEQIVVGASKGDNRGMILLTPAPGDYQAVISEDLALERGQRVDLWCPICQASLASSVHDELAELLCRNEEGQTVGVHFSRTYGEHATFIVSKQGVREYGDDAGTYLTCNFFGAGGEE